MPHRDLVVVGASAGGVEVLRSLVAPLPADLPATLLVVLHLPEGGHSALPQILARAGRLQARHPADNDRLRPGQILVAPPNHHLVVRDGIVRLSHGPTENGHRPAIDPLFRTAARWHGPRVIGVILSGTLDDGTAGQLAVAARGGVTVVQDPADAVYPGMPRSVLEHVRVDHVVSAGGLGSLLDRLCREEFDGHGAGSAPPTMREEREEAAVVEIGHSQSPDPPGVPVGLGCPECGGALFELRDEALIRYRCRVGHAWSPETLLAEQSAGLESALWVAVRTLDDRSALCRRAADAARERGHDYVAGRYDRQRAEAEAAAQVLCQALVRAQRGIGDVPPDATPVTLERPAGPA
ncbi:MAG TPA: chemotaxis protein CheB [Kineosporiaceae bacterium]|nr:chemotaxis protein CheB [Kineosporiaceae bacterium]